ncbi:MAG TPA: hypothetical protein VMT63_02645 [Bacteroidales bacterium]|nr:hypothetical protein [Bacteroidales bacterium]
MKRNFKSAITAVLALLVSAAMIMPASAQKKDKKNKHKEEVKALSGYLLKYNFPDGKPLVYSTITKVDQEMDMNGSQMQVNVAVNLVCSVTANGKDGENLRLNVKLDTLSQTMDSPMGSSGGLINDVAGKSFGMTVAPSGKVIDLKEAEKITYTVEGQENNISQNFINYFPVMQSKELNPGDTWTVNDSITSKAVSMTTKQVFKADYKFEGMVNLDGTDCAKITSVITGTREQKGENMGMDILIKGTFTGTSELFFAVKEGYIIKESSNNKLSGNIEISGGQNMSMPLTATTVSTRTLKK